LYQIRQL